MANGVIKYKVYLADNATITKYITTLQLTTTVLASYQSYFYTCSSAAITSGSLTVPAWSKGIVVTNNASDAAMFGYATGKFFIAFRNSGVWGARRDI